MNKQKKILIIRFSSIGDIILTTPVIRALKLQANAEVHFLTKASFLSVIEANPYITKIHTIHKKVKEQIDQLKKENFDFVIDLHKNFRSNQVIRALRKPSKSFSKLNIEKWMMVKFKWDILPDIHIVDRYLEAGSFLSIENDHKGLDFFFTAQSNSIEHLEKKYDLEKPYVCLALGAAHFTKRIPTVKIIEIIQTLNIKVVLIGGPDERETSIRIVDRVPCINTVGNETIAGSARLIEHAEVLITPDTGMMHIAAALKTKIVSLWGNTIPKFGMYPYMNDDDFFISEVKGLPCRPCSKIGFQECPKKHFNCMNQQNTNQIIEQIQSFIEN